MSRILISSTRPPLFDIKPFVPEFDLREAESIGWLENKSGKAEVRKDDGRLSE